MLTTKRYEYLSFDKIGLHPSIPNHRGLTASKVAHLEKDILTNGLLEPLVVWERNPGEYYLVGGFHRIEAVKNIRKSHPGYFDRIDVRVVSGEPNEIKALNLKLNADRLDTKLTDYFETVLYLNNANWSAARIGDFLDKSSSWIEDIVKFAPMVTQEMRAKLDAGELSWNRAREIIGRTLSAPAGEEQKVLNEELAKPQAHVVKPLTFKSVIGHFSKVVQEAPEKSITISLQDLYSFILLLKGKDYNDKDVKRVKSIFPELLIGGKSKQAREAMAS
jgi:ParB-like chromosome segregation protein Spo0J